MDTHNSDVDQQLSVARDVCQAVAHAAENVADRLVRDRRYNVHEQRCYFRGYCQLGTQGGCRMAHTVDELAHFRAANGAGLFPVKILPCIGRCQFPNDRASCPFYHTGERIFCPVCDTYGNHSAHVHLPD